MNTMNIKWIEDLVCLLETTNFSRAAKLRCLTQSAFSRRIQALEEWCGVKLIDRTRHPIAPTRAALKLQAPLVQMLSLSRQIRATAKELHNAEKSTLRVAKDHRITLGSHQISQLTTIASRAMQVIEIQEMELHEGLEALEVGAIDIIICDCQSLEAPIQQRTDAKVLGRLGPDNDRLPALSAKEEANGKSKKEKILDKNSKTNTATGLGSLANLAKNKSRHQLQNKPKSTPDYGKKHPSNEELPAQKGNKWQMESGCIILLRKRPTGTKRMQQKTDDFWNATSKNLMDYASRESQC